MNADFFRSERAPEFVLLMCQTIDERFPTMDDGQALQTILWRYEPVVHEGPCVLLKRRAIGDEPKPALAVDRVIHFNENVAIDERAADCQTFSLRIELSAFGQLAKLLYHTPPILLHVKTSRGDALTFRLVRPMIGEQTLLNPLLESNEDWLRFFSRDRGERVTSFSLDSPMPVCYRDTVRLVVKQFAKPSSANRSLQDLRRLTGASSLKIRPRRD